MIRYLKSKTAILILVAFQPQYAQSQVYDYQITRIIDGDTVEFVADFLPKPLKPRLSLRLSGIDTPESLHPKCIKEYKLATRAKNYTKNAIKKAQQRQIKLEQWDKFGGRVDGDVILDGTNLSTLLIQNKYAKPYYGGKKHNWCQ